MDEQPYDEYLAHYGVLGMKWGVRKDRDSNKTEKLTDRKVRKEIKKTAKARTKASLKRGVGSGTARKQIKAVVDKREQELPGFRKKVIERQNKVQTRKLTAAIFGIPATAFAIANADKIAAGAKATNYVAKNILFTTLVSVASKRQAAASTAQKGREFAEAMGINAPNVIDLASDAYKVVRHKGFDMALNDYDDDYLAHYGVLGMKWGVRKDGLPQGTLGSGPSYRTQKKELKKNLKVVKKEQRSINKTINKQVRSRSKAEKAERDRKHSAALIEQAFKTPTAMFNVKTNRLPDKQLMTGEEFIARLSRNEAFDVRTAELFLSTSDDSYTNQYRRDAYTEAQREQVIGANRKVNDAKLAYKTHTKSR